MDLELLNCSICPKQPSFSDTSHLLTHVSSKGHLSHLHKLQVRSHQEIAAGVKLATYNQWYQQHGLGQLLSERMVMKEAKKAGRRKAATRRGAYVAQQGSGDENLFEQPLPYRQTTNARTRNQRKTTWGRRGRAAVDDDSDFDFSPIKRSRYRPRRSNAVSPIKRSLSSHDIRTSEEDFPGEDGPQVFATPEHSKLKGTIWPGMNLFDAATMEMRKKRNQKKDGSVLRRMERLAALVEPTEVVYSPLGNMLKARHIDDLEDASSVIDGETPLPKMKQARPRKRQPLADRDVNAPRLVKRMKKGDAPKKEPGLSLNDAAPPLPYLPSSSTGDSYALGSRFLQADDDDEGLKPILGVLSARRRSSHFTIFNDGSPGYSPSIPLGQSRNPFHSGHESYVHGSRQQLPVVAASWLQPPNPTALPYTNPYAVYRPVYRDYQSLYDSKENLPPLADPHLDFPGPNSNPLSWKSPVRDTSGLDPPSEASYGSFFGLFPLGTHHDDPFVTPKNPLTEALEHLEDEEDRIDIKGSPRSVAGTM